jgi:hypothetical protein
MNYLSGSDMERIAEVQKLRGENATLRSELRTLAIKQHVRQKSGGGHTKNGKSCAICKGQWADDAPEFHAATCPLVEQ